MKIRLVTLVLSIVSQLALAVENDAAIRRRAYQ